MVNFPRLASFDDKAQRSAQACVNQMMVHCRGRQQRGDGDPVGGDAAVAQHHNVVVFMARCFGARA